MWFLPARLWDDGSWQAIHELSIGGAPTGFASGGYDNQVYPWGVPR
jgi:hypothetical protein